MRASGAGPSRPANSTWGRGAARRRRRPSTWARRPANPRRRAAVEAGRQAVARRRCLTGRGSSPHVANLTGYAWRRPGGLATGVTGRRGWPGRGRRAGAHRRRRRGRVAPSWPGPRAASPPAGGIVTGVVGLDPLRRLPEGGVAEHPADGVAHMLGRRVVLPQVDARTRPGHPVVDLGLLLGGAADDQRHAVRQGELHAAEPAVGHHHVDPRGQRRERHERLDDGVGRHVEARLRRGRPAGGGDDEHVLARQRRERGGDEVAGVVGDGALVDEDHRPALVEAAPPGRRGEAGGRRRQQRAHVVDLRRQVAARVLEGGRRRVEVEVGGDRAEHARRGRWQAERSPDPVLVAASRRGRRPGRSAASSTRLRTCAARLAAGSLPVPKGAVSRLAIGRAVML